MVDPKGGWEIQQKDKTQRPLQENINQDSRAIQQGLDAHFVCTEITNVSVGSRRRSENREKEAHRLTVGSRDGIRIGMMVMLVEEVRRQVGTETLASLLRHPLAERSRMTVDESRPVPLVREMP